ncbi:glutamate--cysteine ligase [Elasticomyces elasticus]|nr:glutamate--cysteine ligase [Elasticomyces elasticus]
MDTVEHVRHAALPSLAYLDAEKIRREEEYQLRDAGPLVAGMPTVAAMTATTYPSGPPPPYHSHQPPTAHSKLLPTTLHLVAHSPPEPRKKPEHEKDPLSQQPRQSLPSISEALGVEQPHAYAPQTPAPAPTRQTYQAPTPPSPLPTARRSLGMEPPSGPTNSYSQPTSQSQYQAPALYSVPEPSEASISQYPHPQHPRLPVLHGQTSQTLAPLAFHQTAPYAHPLNPSPTYDYPTQAGASIPASGFPYGYTPYPPQYAFPASGTSSNGPVYQPSSTYSAPSQPLPAWKSEPGASGFAPDTRRDSRSNSSTYGESVKRHLDLHDIEGSLNEISQGSSILADFARQYANHLHQTSRSGLSPPLLPEITEVDDLMTKNRQTHEALSRIRDVIIAQQAALDQQAQERQLKAAAEPQHVESSASLDDGKLGGFAGGDAKKRRGRAAPPGRCHSCNRAETPEWRRGPDGARTLCNACGLHYAKLTRKAGNNKAAISSSNLRPKSTGPEGPSA